MSVVTTPHQDTIQRDRAALSKQMRSRHMLGQLGRSLVMLILLVAAAVYLVVPFLATGVPFLSDGWVQRPFVGTFVDYSLRVNPLRPTTPTPFTGLEAGLTAHDRIVAVDDQPVRTSTDLYDYVAQFHAGDSVLLNVQSDDGSTREVKVRLMRLPPGDALSRFVIPYLAGMAYLVIGLWVYRSRREQASARAFLLMCAAMALGVGLAFDAWTTQVFRRLWTAIGPLTGAAAMELGMIFPYEPRIVARRPALSLWPYPIVAVLIIAGQIGLDATPDSYLAVHRSGYIFAAAGAVVLIGMMFYRAIRTASPVAREQARVVMAGSVVAFAPFAVWAVAPNVLSVEWVILAFVIFPLAIGYAILRYRILDSDWLLSRTITYTAMGLLVIIGHTLLVAGASLVVGSTVPATNPVLVAIIIFVTLLLFNPIRARLQDSVDKLFFRSREAYDTRLHAFGQILTLAGELDEVVDALLSQLQETIQPSHAHVYLRSSDGDEFMALNTGNGHPGSDLRFAVDGALATALASSRDMIYLEAGRPVPPELLPDQTLLAVLRTPLLAPMTSQNRLIGWLAVGPKRTRELYRVSDLRFVEGLTQQAALAVERAQVMADLQQRVRELDVLSQVSQAVNFTLEFDDLLELIYTQASKVVDTTNFYITLYNQGTDALHHAFFLENDERLTEMEDQSWPADEGLAGDVLRTGRPIRTDDYVTECARRKVKPHNPRFRAWMGAPLNVGLSTLGVMSVASYSNLDPFTDEQLKVFWAIADQAASALDKARLFADAEARARQLATLNEISNTLASTLDLEQLLTLIMKSAVKILEAEAGSLLLVDLETDELVFRVMEGGAEELVGTRLQRGVGLVGAVATTADSIIVNDVANDPRWFSNTDEDTGFTTKAIVAVPLQVQSTVIGVLELLNKQDGSDFTQEDVSLLATFAGQAAVAIENARLYHETDQALSARVDELSMLQRIDRELNTTLEIERVIHITLDWALRVSGALAGAVGMVDDEGTALTILAGQGYEAAEQARSLPIAAGNALARVMANQRPELLKDVSHEPATQTLNDNTVAQMIVPILRVHEVIGALVLESNISDVLRMDDLDFINRLTEHASVAISNARLFQEVEAANRAKTEFVSFVSHELKTPMTSIRGYTDLLLSGQVGEVNDMQGQFLSTIRSNVDRMSRLVSDLADVSRIEAGQLRLEVSPVPVSVVVEETLRSTQAQVDDKEQTLTTEVPADIPSMMADQTRMVQVLTNLVSNAYKYTPEGGTITISAEQTQDRDDEGRPFEVVRVSVRDTGMGMSPEDLEQLFTKFFRSSNVKGSIPGTGLGMNITKNLIELHGGHIWVESTEGEGTTVTYTIPVAEGAAPEA